MAGEGIKTLIPALENWMLCKEETEQGFGEEEDMVSLFLMTPRDAQPLNFDIQTGSLKS